MKDNFSLIWELSRINWLKIAEITFLGQFFFSGETLEITDQLNFFSQHHYKWFVDKFLNTF